MIPAYSRPWSPRIAPGSPTSPSISELITWGSTCPGGPQLLQPRELQPCYGAPLFPSLQSLQPLAWHSLRDSEGSAATEQLCFKWPRAVWSFDPVQAGRPCQLLLSRHQPCSQTLRGAPSEHLSVRLPCDLATPPLSQPRFSYFSFQDRTGRKGRVKWNQLLRANLQDLAQLRGL